MAQTLLLFSILTLALSGLPSLLLRRGSGTGELLSLLLVLAASIGGLVGAFLGLFGASSAPLLLPLPALAESSFDVDPLTAFFLVPVFLIGALAALYARGYRPASRNPRNSRQATVFLGLLLAGLAALLMARNAFAFLLGWEFMALSAFFLVLLDDARAETRHAGFVYIVATHVGTLLLFAFFALWRSATGSFDLVRVGPGLLDSTVLNVLFLLAFLAFGLKAGVMPLHFWLPGAHAAAPSQVSALLSGVVLKMGIYGILRVVFLLPGLPAFWGTTILVLGAASSLLGVAFALAQHDLKRLLAYHSVENIGIILMGIGLSLIGASSGRPWLEALGLAAALLHVWNHALFKSLLFLGAGSVVSRAGTRRIDLLGGLAKPLPWTAAFFLLGAVAIAGLPPLNGFVSEFLVYLGALRGVVARPGLALPALITVTALAATGALALACFVKVYGTVFLGQARRPERPLPAEAPLSMLLPMALMAAACAFIGLAPGPVGAVLDLVLAFWSSGSAEPLPALAGLAPLAALGRANITIAIIGAAATLAAFLVARARMKGARPGTWDCGYAAPTARMQYTAASFARPLLRLLAWALRPRVRPPLVEGAFPAASSTESHVGDSTLDGLILPLSRRLEGRLSFFRRFQQGLTQQYILYILIAILVLLGTMVPFGEWLSGLLAG